jgi:hypothetical protein
MTPSLRQHGRFLALTTCAGLASVLLAGCIDRRFIITTEPNISPTDQSITKVLINGRPVGAAPVDKQWLYNGVYQITLIKDGYETTVINQPVPAKWYEFFPLDFVFENVYPFMIRDVRTFNYTLKPLQMVPPEIVHDAADQLRAKGRSIAEAPVLPGAVRPAVSPEVLRMPTPLTAQEAVPGGTAAQPPATLPPAAPPAILPSTMPPAHP